MSLLTTPGSSSVTTSHQVGLDGMVHPEEALLHTKYSQGPNGVLTVWTQCREDGYLNNENFCEVEHLTHSVNQLTQPFIFLLDLRKGNLAKSVGLLQPALKMMTSQIHTNLVQIEVLMREEHKWARSILQKVSDDANQTRKVLFKII